MPQHMVIFQNPDGDPGYNQFDSIEDAVSFVEKIRNEQGIDSIRIFELEEVKFDLKPYYRVELQALKAGPSSSSGPSSTPSSPAPAPAPAPAAPAPPAPTAAPEPPVTSTSPFAPPADGAPSSFPAPPPPGGPGAGDAPVPPADQPEEDAQPTRRGLFGR